MSRSNPTQTNSPVTRKFEWNGQVGNIKYYDKQLKDNVQVELPFLFIVLDDKHTITGFSDSAGSGIWSNNISDFGEELTVRTKNGIIAKGQYTDIREKVKNMGGRYASATFIAYKDGGELKIGVLELKGAAVNSWIDFKKANNINEIAVNITSAVEGKKGAIRYFIPSFAANKISDETDQKAIELDKELQAFFNNSKSSDVADVTNDVDERVQTLADAFSDDIDLDPLPF